LLAGEALGYWTLASSQLLPTGSLESLALGVWSYQEWKQAYEHLPFDFQTRREAAVPRGQAPVPQSEWLRGARDREPFLVEDPLDVDNEKWRADADARYYLIELVRRTKAQNLTAAARSDVRHTALLEKPEEYRGELIHIEGELLWVKTFELKRAGTGLPHIYEGLIEAGGRRPYWILFTELPAGFPPEDAWSRLSLHGVHFNGYFLKVLRTDNPEPRLKAKFLYFPVLVGKTVELPAPTPGWALRPLLWTILPVFGAIVVVVLVLSWLYRRGERRYLAKMEEVRQRARQRTDQPADGHLDTPGSEPFPWADGPPLHPPEPPPADGPQPRAVS
jgi:hypothetical protein